MALFTCLTGGRWPLVQSLFCCVCVPWGAPMCALFHTLIFTSDFICGSQQVCHPLQLLFLCVSPKSQPGVFLVQNAASPSSAGERRPGPPGEGVQRTACAALHLTPAWPNSPVLPFQQTYPSDIHCVEEILKVSCPYCLWSEARASPCAPPD